MRDSKGHKTLGYVRKVYRSGKNTFVAPLPKYWVRNLQKSVMKELHYVDITILESLWLKPHFLHLPYRVHEAPVLTWEYIPQLAGEPVRATAEQPQPLSSNRPLEAQSNPNMTSNSDDRLKEAVLRCVAESRHRKESYLPVSKRSIVPGRE